MSDVEWCQNCGDVVTDDGCACAAIPKPTGVLTREQLEASCREYERLLEQKRATIEQQAQELDILEKEAVSYKRVIESNQKEFSKLEQQLAAMTHERDELNIAVTSGIRHRQEYVERIDALVIELAAMTQERDEANASHSQTVTAFMYLQRKYDELQATLAAREAQLHDVKTQCGKNALSHMSEYYRAEDAVQDAARLREALHAVMQTCRLESVPTEVEQQAHTALKGA